MASRTDDRKKIRCSFCSKTQEQVRKLIASSSRETYICDECIELCNEILDEELFNFKQEEQEKPRLQRFCQELQIV